MAEQTKYINGLFIEEREGQYGTYLTIGITDDGIENLRNAPRNDKGIRNFTGSRQKNNNQKYSVQPYVAKQQGSGNGASRPTGTQGSAIDGLPF